MSAECAWDAADLTPAPPDCIYVPQVVGHSVAAHLRRGDGARERHQPQPGAASQDGVLEPVAILL